MVALKNFHILVDYDFFKRMCEAAYRLRVSKSQFARQALIQYLEIVETQAVEGHSEGKYS